MGHNYYRVIIEVYGGPIGYSYIDSYETEICYEISEAISSAHSLNLNIEKEDFESRRQYYLYIYDLHSSKLIDKKQIKLQKNNTTNLFIDV